MADTKEYLYPKREDNQRMKDVLAEAVKTIAPESGARVKFDKEVGAYELVTDGLNKTQTAALKKAMGEFRGKGAKAEWEADRAAGMTDKEALRSEARARESTTTEVGPKNAGIPMYPALSQRQEFDALIRETGSTKSFIKTKGEEISHFRVVTAVPDRFAQFVGPEAMAKYEREFAERGTERPNAKAQADIEAGREEAGKRAGAAFMAQYQDRGFRLSDPEANPANHAKQLAEMESATKAQLLRVIGVSRELLTSLGDKEVGLRAEAAGVPVEQMKGLSYDDQKRLAGEKSPDGKAPGLVGEEYYLQQSLVRGVQAIDNLLKSRGIGQSKDTAEKGQDQGQDQGERRSPRAQAKGPAVSEDKSVDDTLLTLQASASRRGQGR